VTTYALVFLKFDRSKQEKKAPTPNSNNKRKSGTKEKAKWNNILDH